METKVEIPQKTKTTMKFDEIDLIFVNEGNLTRFNILLHIWGFLAAVSVCWNLVMTVFTGANPGWMCAKNHTSQFCMINANKSFLVNHESFDERCRLNKNEWVYLTDNLYSFVTEFDLICEKRTLAALVSSSYYVGGIIGAFFTGVVADHFGRKPVIMATLLIGSLASFSGFYIKNIWQLFICNVFVGGAQVGCFFTLFTYVFELVAPKHRVVSNGLLQAGLIVSFLFIDLISYFVRDWRKLKLYSSFPCLVPFVISLLIPESPRWLLSKGKVSKSKTALSKIINFNQSEQKIDSLTTPRRKTSKTHKELFETPSLSVLTLSIAFLRFIVFAVYYILLFDSPYLGGDLYQSFALASLPDLVSCITYPLYANRIGRRKAIFGSLMITAVLSCSMSFTPNSYPYKYYINMAFLILAIFFGNVALATSNTWVFEIFPTCLRARGISICTMSDRFGILISPFIIRLLQGVHHNISYYIVCALCVVGVIVSYFILPETRNRPTRESIEDFKGRMRNVSERKLSSFDNVVHKIDVLSSS